MSERWSADDIWALAPDAASRKAAAQVARTPSSWPVRGLRSAAGVAEVLWGECSGSGATPYRAAVHFLEPGSPAYRCSCPSRKFPCKHTLALLHLWSGGHVAEAGDPPGWVAGWLAERGGAAAGGTSPRPAADAAGRQEQREQRARRREDRVADGLAELELWLRDQIGSGLAGARDPGYAHYDDMAARLVDAQAARIADRVRDLAGIGRVADWPSRLLAEYALLRLLISGYRRRDRLPAPLGATVRSRAGIPAAADESAPVRDTWQVLGQAFFDAGQVRGRRIWLRGGDGRAAALVSFARPGQAPDAPVRIGTEVDADLAFHPAESRAVVTRRHAERRTGPPRGGTVADALASWARALADDPWLEAWPVVVADSVIGRNEGWWLADPTGAALPLHAASAPPWQWAAVTGGAPATVAAEWTPHGLRPLTVWDPDGAPVQLTGESV
ncbi:SWIM zinc finger family protein [Nocardiopsis mangrovi]|uniref:SWIM zinc finger family protein n=1 Tax=Nocardiopsis mangrovi TaxID=1179818 RepID=A0ABV9E1S5_9ACTN